MDTVGKTSETAEIYCKYQNSPSSRLRYSLALSNIEALHGPLSAPRDILDAAGGNGLNTEYFLGLGHNVTLYDINPAMLAQAEQRIAPLGLPGKVKMVQGALEDVSDLLPNNAFDFVMLHHVIEYLSDVPAALAGIRTVTRKAGELSLITLNPVSEVIRSILFQKDAVAARDKLTNLSYDAKWFGEAMLYEREQVVAWAEASGWRLNGYHGMRILSDYVPDAEISREDERLLTLLERDMAGRDPYRQFGRYLQFAFVAV